jgi:uncharacterized protein (TIGR03067 family)
VVRLRLDPGAGPPAVDFARRPYGLAGTSPGIYRLEGDTLTLCWAGGRKPERPAEFASRPGTETTLLVLRRVQQ